MLTLSSPAARAVFTYFGTIRLRCAGGDETAYVDNILLAGIF